MTAPATAGAAPAKRGCFARLLRLFGCLFLLGLLAAGAVAGWGWRELHRPQSGPRGGGSALFVVSPGESAGGILRRLEGEGRIGPALLARAWLRWARGAPHLKAGEYELPAGMSTIEILGKLERGEIRTIAWRLRRLCSRSGRSTVTFQ